MDDKNVCGNVKIREFRPGDASYISYLHMRLYQELYGFHGIFEYYVMKGLVEFLHNPDGGQMWVAEIDGEIVASIAIVKADDSSAQLRWFLVTEQCQGKGIGKKLVKIALDFCGERRYKKILLWTANNLGSARHLYESNGFVLVESKPNTEWTDELLYEELWELNISV